MYTDSVLRQHTLTESLPFQTTLFFTKLTEIAPSKDDWWLERGLSREMEKDNKTQQDLASELMRNRYWKHFARKQKSLTNPQAMTWKQWRVRRSLWNSISRKGTKRTLLKTAWEKARKRKLKNNAKTKDENELRQNGRYGREILYIF